MKSLPRSFGGIVTALAFLTSTSAHAGNLIEGIWDDGWMGGYGAWLPLGLALIVCFLIWLARRKQRK